jgi:hypothetical protein
MIWLFLFMLWSLSVAINGPTASRPAAKMLLYLVALLGFLHMLVTAIEILQFLGL